MITKNEKEKQFKKKTISSFIITFLALALVLSIPMVSAASFGSKVSSFVSKVVNVISSVVNFVKNFVTHPIQTVNNPGQAASSWNAFSGGSGSSGSGSGSNNVGGGGTGTSYQPYGFGSMTNVVVYQKPSQTFPGSKALYHDVDLGEVALECINCPSTNPMVAGFDYKITMGLINKGNNKAEGVKLFVEALYPDGSKDTYAFDGNNALTIETGNYDFQFVIKSLGVDKNTRKLLPFAIVSGQNIKAQFPVKITARVENDKGVDRYETIGVLTPQERCSWVSTGLFSYKYSCVEIEPLREIKTLPFTIPANDNLNKLESEKLINRLSPNLFGSSQLGGL